MKPRPLFFSSQLGNLGVQEGGDDLYSLDLSIQSIAQPFLPIQPCIYKQSHEECEWWALDRKRPKC